MHKLKFILIIIVLGVNANAQNVNTRNINTGNWLELSYSINEEELQGDWNYEDIIVAEYPGGYDSLANFLLDTLHYPISAMRDSIGGRVVSRFIVDTLGQVSYVEIMKSARYDFDSACYNALLSLPDWTPGRFKNGPAVSMFFHIPIVFIFE